ncbi:MAG: hypothetical protein ACE37F_07770 [Nannocystaceae bacterium]|nr:hypothetical protein [bacterium]
MVARRWLVLGLLLFSAGCTRRVYFSQSIRDGLEGSAGMEDATKREAAEDSLQYFAAHRIVLERDAKSRDENISGGRIIVRRGRLIEQVVIRRGTPGIATDWGDDWIAVSFEEGTSLVFEKAAADRGGSVLYRLRTSAGPLGAPVVDFNNLGWKLASAHYNATLQVKRNAAGKRKKRRRVLQGRKL